MTRIWPLVQATIQAALLSALSNFLAQLLASYKSSKPFQPSFTPILKFFIFTLISTPPNYLWQGRLEKWYPSYVNPAAFATNTKKEDDVEEKASLPVAAIAPVTTLNKPNIFKKLLWDQFVGSPVNNCLFLVGMGLLSGFPWEQIMWNVQKDFWRFQRANWKVWPCVAVIAFSFVPVERRVLFGSTVGLLWTIYISFMMGEV